MSAKAPGASGTYERRAEELIDRTAGDVRRFAERIAGRVREEAEDLIAEARSRRDAPPSTTRRSD